MAAIKQSFVIIRHSFVYVSTHRHPDATTKAGDKKIYPNTSQSFFSY